MRKNSLSWDGYVWGAQGTKVKSKTHLNLLTNLLVLSSLASSSPISQELSTSVISCNDNELENAALTCR